MVHNNPTFGWKQKFVKMQRIFKIKRDRNDENENESKNNSQKRRQDVKKYCLFNKFENIFCELD